MSRKAKGTWPYHQKRNGDWVACDSNPCRRHSSGDIMATSPEDAFAKADILVAMKGQGFAGMRKVSNKGADEAHAFAQARRDHDARVRKAMKGFCADKVKDPAKIPGLFTRDRLGKFTQLYRHADMGGKYLQTRNMDDHKLAKVIEGDIAKLRKAGGVPEGWKVDVKAINSVESNGFDITISRPEGSTPAFRSIRPTDIYDPNHEGELNSGVRHQMEEDTGIQNCTYRQAASYCRKHPEIQIPTAENEDTVRYVQEVADQYGLHAESQDLRMRDDDHRSTVRLFDKERKKDEYNDNTY